MQVLLPLATSEETLDSNQICRQHARSIEEKKKGEKKARTILGNARRATERPPKLVDHPSISCQPIFGAETLGEEGRLAQLLSRVAGPDASFWCPGIQNSANQ